MSSASSLAALPERTSGHAEASGSISSTEDDEQRALPFPRVLEAHEAVAEFAAVHRRWPRSRFALHRWAQRVGLAHRSAKEPMRQYVDPASELLRRRRIRVKRTLTVGPSETADDHALAAHLPRRPPRSWTDTDRLLALAQASAAVTPGRIAGRREYASWAPAAHAAPSADELAQHPGGYVQLRSDLAALGGSVRELGQGLTLNATTCRRKPNDLDGHDALDVLRDPDAIVRYLAEVLGRSSLRFGQVVSADNYDRLGVELGQKLLPARRLMRHAAMVWPELRQAAWAHLARELEGLGVSASTPDDWTIPAVDRPMVAYPPVLTVGEAIAEFAIYHGAWPASRLAVEKWGEVADVAHRAFKYGIETYLEDAVVFLERHGVAISAAETASPRHVRRDLPRPAGLPHRPAARPTRRQCIDALRQASSERLPGERRLTRKGYNSWGPGGHAAPTLKDMERHGGFVQLRAVALPQMTD